MTPPSRAVLEAFRVTGPVADLAGGEGLAVRVGEVVLKRVHDVVEAEWIQALLSEVVLDDVRIAPPIRAADGAWSRDGWIASELLAGLRPAAPDWPRVIDAGLRFADAAEAVRRGGDEVLARRQHRWAVADRVAWGEADVRLSPEADEVRRRIEAQLFATPDHQVHFVHGDLSGNVFVDPDGLPVVLDVSPYLRPRRWAEAIVVADAVLWEGADLGLARSFAADDVRRDLFCRALLYRMVAEQLAADPRHGALLPPYRAVLAVLS